MRSLAAWLSLTVLLVVVAPAGAAAEIQLGGLNLSGEIEAGPVFYLVEPSKSRKAKFEEYRDMTEGLWLHNLSLRLSTPDEGYATELYGSKWGYEDQRFGLTAGRIGVWQFYFEWDQIPKVYSTNSRMLADEEGRGVFRLPTPRPPLGAYNSAEEIDEISTRWDTARMGATFSITPDMDVTAEYTRIHKHGDKPFSLAFGSPGNNFMEVLEPVDHTIHDIRLKATLAREQYQIQFAYGLSIFQNEFNKVFADNPCFGPGGTSPCGGSDTIRSGQISLPPDNMAHSFNLAAGVNLPLRTRLTANVNYSLRLQSDTFLPHTINPALAGNADLVLPQKDLNGNVQTVLVNLMGVMRPLPKLTLSAKYRYYNMFDVGDVIHFERTVVNDRSFGPARRAGRWDYSKQNAEVGGRYRLLQPLTIGLAVGWERWDRNEHREVAQSDEIYAKATVDVTPADWLLVRATYRPAIRRIDDYHTRAHGSHTVLEEDAAAALQGQSLLLRKYDQGERDEQRVDLMLQITPLESLTITPTGSFRYDDYVDSRLGLQEETRWSAGVDLTWAPHERVSFSAGYVHERIEQTMRSRSRPVAGGVTFDFKDFDWVSDMYDTIDTFYAGVKLAVIPRVLDWSSGVQIASAVGRLETNNPIPPTSGTAGQRASATAQPFPATEDNFVRVDAALRYHFLKHWSATLGYAFESFQKNDWRTDRLTPVIPGVASIWLGDDDRNYAAHIIGLSLGYRF
jgi:MtrB/PioB family decaheme-associated outer membrane protein